MPDVARAEREPVHVGRGGDERVGELDSVRAPELLEVSAGRPADADVEREAVQDPQEIGDDELLPGPEAGLNLGDRNRRPGEEVAGGVPALHPACDVFIATQPVDDDVAV